jgi:soluble lytic murein transglycosylase-like protein
MGLFQVMPFHFQLHEDPYNPQTNAKRGLTYLARGLELAGGRIDLALAGYNGGHSVIFKDSSEWPAETRRYVSWGMGILDDLASDAQQMPTLLAWLEAGGDGLCRQAARAQSE